MNSTSALRNLIPGALLLLLLVLSFLVLQEFAFTLIWAFIIAYISWPVYQWLLKKLKGNALLSAAILAGFIAISLFIIIYSVTDLLQNEISEAYQSLADNIAKDTLKVPDFLLTIPWLSNVLQDLINKFNHDQTQFTGHILNFAKQWLGQFTKIIGSIGRYVVNLCVILITVFFCFRDGDAAIKQVKLGLTHSLGKYQPIYWQAIGNTTRAVVYGIVLAACAQGALACIGYAVTGIQAPVLLGVVTALLALVPMGATLIWLPSAAFLLLTGQVWPGIGLFLWGFFVVSTVDNIIRPIVISGTGKVPFLVVLFGVLGGLSAFGLIGLFLGPVILSVLLAVWQAWLAQQTEGSPKE